MDEVIIEYLDRITIALETIATALGDEHININGAYSEDLVRGIERIAQGIDNIETNTRNR